MGGADEPVRRRRAEARDAIERERGTIGDRARRARDDASARTRDSARRDVRDVDAG